MQAFDRVCSYRLVLFDNERDKNIADYQAAQRLTENFQSAFDPSAARPS